MLSNHPNDPWGSENPLAWVIVAVATSVIGFILDQVFNQNKH